MCSIFHPSDSRYFEVIMANSFDELIGMIRKVVLDVVRYNVPRLGIVSKIADIESGKARILVLIPSLGWDTDEKGAWCGIIESNGLITPNVGDYVIIQFLDGDRDLPVYMGKATQMKDMLPNSYVDENTQILFENRAKDFSIRYDEANELLNIGVANESFVKGDTLNTWITGTLKPYIDSHVHPGVTTGGGSTLPPAVGITAPSNYLSERIKGE